ncbi:Hpt domain-containing protein [Rhodoferax sp.]|uniref:Hpt domain-containing protein n=1 Tax=Rhodoferax sp. TaxID=50421 RepID=UPI0025D2A8EC|nr:Hpt domain-containing protein [Rhodoferax sp.]
MNILLVGTRATPGHDAVLRALLLGWGHQVLEGDGPADLALLDLDGDADTVLAHPMRPALGLASFDHPGTAERCQAAGLHTLLWKPVHPAELRAALDAQAFDYAQALLQADPWIVGVVAPMFMRDWPLQLDALEAATHAADAPTAHRIAHTLKGLVANFHATPLVRRAQALEVDSAQCATPAYQAQVATLRAQLGRLDVALVAFCLAHPDAI